MGPVGSKCRDCTRGIPVGAGAKERTSFTLARTVADRLLGLKVLLSLMAGLDLLSIAARNSEIPDGFGVFGWALSSSRYSINPWAIRHGQWWRILTGGLANGSPFTMVPVLMMVWWLGRRVTPHLSHAKFFVVLVSSVGAAVLLLIATAPGRESFGGLSVLGGLVGLYLVLRRRGEIRQIRGPAIRQWGFFGLFLVWIMGNSLVAEAGAAVGFGCGVVGGGLAAWVFTDPVYSWNPRRVVGVGAVVAFALFGGAVAKVWTGNSPQPHPGVFATALQQWKDQVVPPSDGEWVSVHFWEDSTDVGDFQTYHVQCQPTMRTQQVAPIVKVDAAGVCGWLAGHPGAYSARESVAARCAALLVRRVVVEGRYRGQSVSAQFEVADDVVDPTRTRPAKPGVCGSALAIDAHETLASFQ
jgi:membrane associated rhomboid family serine protease